jgi:hypothetical protein
MKVCTNQNITVGYKISVFEKFKRVLLNLFLHSVVKYTKINE